MKKPGSDQFFDFINITILLILIVIMAYPIYFVLIASVSDPTYVNSGQFLLWPKGFSLLGYRKVFEDNRIWIGYFNTLIYVIGGCILGVMITMMAGFALSRKELPFRGFFMGYFVFTMYFGGGLIPFYMVMKTLHLTNTRTLMVLISAVSVYNIIVTRSFMENTIPEELRMQPKWMAAETDISFSALLCRCRKQLWLYWCCFWQYLTGILILIL